jgi:hypothetical protein
VSAEPEAVEFYKSLGCMFFGKQKSGCQLSMAKIPELIGGVNFRTCAYDPLDLTIGLAIHKKGKGGCVEVFDKPQGD